MRATMSCGGTSLILAIVSLSGSYRNATPSTRFWALPIQLSSR